MENKLAHALVLMGEGSFTHAPEHGVNDIKVHMTTWLWMLLKNKNNLTFDFLSGKCDANIFVVHAKLFYVRNIRVRR